MAYTASLVVCSQQERVRIKRNHYKICLFFLSQKVIRCFISEL